MTVSKYHHTWVYKRVIPNCLRRPRLFNSVIYRDGCMNYSTLMALPPKLSILWQGYPKLVVLKESLPATLSIMPNVLYHASVTHYNLKCAPGQIKESSGLLKIPRQSLMKRRPLSTSIGMLDKPCLDNVQNIAS